MGSYCPNCGCDLMSTGSYTPSFSSMEKPGVKLSSRKRKLSAWNRFVKANSKKPRFRLRSGKLNLKKMGIAFRKKK